ncbi:hypothetical protein ABT340_15615 [Streptosporangium sp. NPDC000239]|uniref:hypothetical protein n=1 Tax=Streptosporangium sp. NPDC000239 TaxID=3154248 RepID=UPI0033310BEF
MSACPTCGHTREPAIDSVVLDVDSDAWQRRPNGWNCTVHEIEYKDISWGQLLTEFGPIRIIHTSTE